MQRLQQVPGANAMQDVHNERDLVAMQETGIPVARRGPSRRKPSDPVVQEWMRRDLQVCTGGVGPSLSTMG